MIDAPGVPAVTPTTKPKRTETRVWTTPGRVELIDSMGSDLAIIRRRGKSFDSPPPAWEYDYSCVACLQVFNDGADPTCSKQGENHSWVQTNRRLSLKHLDRLEEAIVKKHASIFEGIQFEFHVKAPIKVARDWFRHRTHSFNEESTRFSLIKHEFYVPTGELMRTQTGSAAQAAFSPLEEPFGTVASDIIREQCEQAFDAYETMLMMGVAREVASYALPLATMTSFYDTVNLRNLWAFLALRASGGFAIREMQLLVDQVEALATPIVPQAMRLWIKNGRMPL